MPNFFAINKCVRVWSVAANRQGPIGMLELNRGYPLRVRVNILGNRPQLSKTRGDFQRTRGQVHRERSFSQLGLTEKDAGPSGVAAKSDVRAPKGMIYLNRVVGRDVDSFCIVRPSRLAKCDLILPDR